MWWCSLCFLMWKLATSWASFSDRKRNWKEKKQGRDFPEPQAIWKDTDFLICRLRAVLQWYVREHWSRGGENTRLPPKWPGFDFQTRRHMWVEFVSSFLCSERFYPGYSGFSLSSKTYISLAERSGLSWLLRFQSERSPVRFSVT